MEEESKTAQALKRTRMSIATALYCSRELLKVQISSR